MAGSNTAIIGQDDDYCIAIADRLEAVGGTVIRISKDQSLDSGLYADGTALWQSSSGSAVRLLILPESVHCGAHTMRKMHWRPLRHCARPD